jgi:hypothetical protein
LTRDTTPNMNFIRRHWIKNERIKTNDTKMMATCQAILLVPKMLMAKTNHVQHYKEITQLGPQLGPYLFGMVIPAGFMGPITLIWNYPKLNADIF